MNQNQQNRHNFHKQPTKKERNRIRTKTVLHSHRHSHTNIAMSFRVIFFLLSFTCSDSYLIYLNASESIRQGIICMEFVHAKQQKLYRCIHFIFILHKIYTQTRNFTVAAIVVVAFYGLLVIYLFWSFFLHFIQFDFYGRFCFMPNPSVHSTHQRQSYSTMKRYNNCVFVCVYMSC